jgi:hypothetical protein
MSRVFWLERIETLLLVAVGKPLLFASLFLLRVPEHKNLRHPQYMPKGYSVP